MPVRFWLFAQILPFRLTAGHVVLVHSVEVRILQGQQKVSSNVRDTSIALGARTLEVRILLPQPINTNIWGMAKLVDARKETRPHNFL